MSAAGTASAAAGAAAAAARVRAQEEEEMTPYSSQDLNEDWEFKILRSMRGAFGDPQQLQSILEVERQAGWVLVEKFDHGRIRLKRPVSARAGDSNLGFDAYRTYVGPSETRYTLTILGLVFGGVIAAVAMIALIASLVD
jgi:hypothetical protein